MRLPHPGDGRLSTRRTMWEYPDVGHFFGGATVFAREGRLLLVADPTAGGQSRGVVSIYRAYNASEKLGGVDEIQRQTLAAGQRFRYDFSATLSNRFNVTLGGTAPVNDQFGASLASAADVVVVGAPAVGCVYTFAIPTIDIVSAVDTIDGAANPNITVPTPTFQPSPNRTQTPEDPSPPVQIAPSSSSNDRLALILGIVCGLLGLVLFGAGTWKYAKSRHRRQKFELMKLKDAMLESKSLVAQDGTGRAGGAPL
eukprot:Opistho-2@3171